MSFLDRLIRPWLLFDSIYKLTSIGQKEQQQSQDLTEACRKMIEQNRENSDSAKKKKTSLLGYMLEMSEKHPGSLSDEDIINECCTFMLAGQDSVGTATAMTLFLLANHQYWQEKCREELDEIFGNSDRTANMQDLKMMRNIEMCIKEALRLYPSVPLFARTLGEDVKVGKKFVIKFIKTCELIIFRSPLC